jgi:hypothetical protein
LLASTGGNIPKSFLGTVAKVAKIKNPLFLSVKNGW